jgi:ethanolamine ammonia-lyase large subunit
MMGVPGADDIMLNYQSTSFHDALVLREITGLQRAPEFEAWLQRQEITDLRGQLLEFGAAQPLISGLRALTDAKETP